MKNFTVTLLTALLLVGVTAALGVESPVGLADPAAFAVSKRISALWANDGGDKVPQEEIRVKSGAAVPKNSVWTGDKVKLFGAKNEVVAFNLVLEAASLPAENVSVAFSKLTGPHGSIIGSVPAIHDHVFDWTQRNIELFFIRYLKIEGLSGFSYQSYDERHVPKALQRPWSGPKGEAKGTWKDRPNAGKSYPDIAVPFEMVRKFDIAKGTNQSVWVDIYVPRFTEAGLYKGTLTVSENGRKSVDVAVELQVRNFTLPEVPSSKTMVFLGYEDLIQRYFGKSRLKAGSDNDKALQLIRDRHFQLAHRHKISLIDQNQGSQARDFDSPRPEWMSRLDGSLFTPLHGYEGPGAYTGNGIYAVGAYNSWGWKKDDDEGVMHEHADRWVKWFKTYFPDTEYFLYLIDESTDFVETQKWASWLKSNKGVGKELKSFATIPLPEALADAPDLDISASWLAFGDRPTWEKAVKEANSSSKKYYAYNGKRPGSGSFATEDDGVALRELPWGQYKMGVDRWFFWESTYYRDFQKDGGRENDLFHDARTMGRIDHVDPVAGKVGYDTSNGDGVLFYPGTDLSFPDDSYGLQGPIASLRLKHWRRGIQDVDYLTLASKIDPVRTKAIVNAMIPKVLWENGVDNPKDPTYVYTDLSWSNDPDVWEAARTQLADIIEGKKN